MEAIEGQIGVITELGVRLRSHRVRVRVQVFVYVSSVTRTSFTRTSGVFAVTCASTIQCCLLTIFSEIELSECFAKK